MLAAGIGALAAAPASAAGSGERMRTASFGVTVSGTQTTTWTTDHTRFDGCTQGDVRTVGSGRQRFTFRSTRRGTLDVIRVGRDVMVSAGAGGLRVAGGLDQRGTMRLEQLGGGPSFCGGTDTPQAPPAPDCGTRSWRGRIDPVVLDPRRPVLALTGPVLAGEGSFTGLFANCPGSEGLLEEAADAALPLGRIFSTTRRIVITGRAAVVDGADGTVNRTRTTWRAVLTRRAPASRPPVRGVPQCANGRDDDGDGDIDFPRDAQCTSVVDRSER